MTSPNDKAPISDQENPRGGAGFGWLLLERILSYLDDLAVILVSTLALILTLGLTGLTHGGIIDPLAELLLSWFGWGSYLFPLALALIVLYIIRSRLLGMRTSIHWLRVISVEVGLFAALGLLSLIDGLELPRAEIGHGGGIVGWGLASLFVSLIGKLGTGLFLSLLALAGVVLASGGIIEDLLRRKPRSIPPEPMKSGPAAASATTAARPAPEAASIRSLRNLPRAYRKNFRVESHVDDLPRKHQARDERLPPFDILETGRMATVTAKEINLAAGLIEKTLADFGLPARVVDFRTGPVVTQFAVEPGYLESEGQDGEVRRHKVRVSQISSLSNDLALALSAPRVRIEAPVPGHAYVGIEVPNRRPATVRLRPILETEPFQSIPSPLAIALGRDVAGQAISADLAAMPHLLIAGTTGSGKSVAIASLTCCLAINNTPEDLRLVMIDPKMVELIRFNGLPHLIGKVETDLDRIIGVLRWCTVEMDRRYRLLEAAKARDIEMYNRRIRRKSDAERLPRLVVLIDELADLMMMAPDQTEHTLVRLAQMARATGIHLVVATQRPSTDIVTGLIKANFPARISFAVASGIDSRVILDGPGAESLLGKGDMLYLSPEAGAPVRIQGALVTDQEIERLIGYWKKEVGEAIEDEVQPPWEDLLIKQAVLDDRDEILEAAIKLVRDRGEASASLLQRALRVGYPRAARLMDELEELGVVGRAQSGGRTREVLISEDEDPLTPATAEDGDDEDA